MERPGLTSKLWYWSTILHRRGLTPLARVLKTFTFVTCGAALPYECEIADDVRLWHRGLGVVVAPSTRVGRDVRFAHGVTIGAAAGTDDQPPGRVVIEDGVRLGSGCIVLAGAGRVLTVGANSHIGAGAIVTKDVAPGAVMVGPAAHALS